MKKKGKQTVVLPHSPVIATTATVVGPMEGKGPLAGSFDRIHRDNTVGEVSFEKAECKMLEEAITIVLEKAKTTVDEIDCMLAGDLLNQNITAGFCARHFGIPFYGIFGACSTLAEAVGMGSMLIDGEFAHRVIVGVSSHNSSAERQYRYPTEYGGQKPPYSQWTVTGAAAALLEKGGAGPRVTAVTTGRVIDKGIKDPFNMGSAMAPAAAHTFIQHLEDLGKTPEDYDLVITGDLGGLGRELFHQLLEREGIRAERHIDCGLQVYYQEQGVNAGGSGCACSGVVVFGDIYQQLIRSELTRVIVIATGSLHNPTTYAQGETMPAIAHAFVMEYQQGGNNNG